MIRFATEEDRAEIERISDKYARETLLGEMTDEQMAGLIDLCMGDGIVLLAERDSRIVGIIAGRFVEGFSLGKFFEEILWYVEPGFRGIGILLFKKLMTSCAENQCSGVSMWAYCNEHLEGVDRLYKREGFKEIERKYYKKL